MPRVAQPQIWAQLRAELGAGKAVAILPKDNVLLGQIAIMEYLGIRERRILEVWIDNFALPVVKRPDGIWMTTLTSIDTWIFMAARLSYQNKFKEGKTVDQRRERSRAQEIAKQSAKEGQAEVQRG